MTILPDLSDLIIEQVSVTDGVTITIHAASPTACCPCCGTICKRIHSHYTRTLHDLPASGRLVHLKVQVRRFFCQESMCQRKIFAERFPSLTLPRAKFTLRLQEALQEMGFELGGEAGARLGKRLSYPGSSDTILRLVKQAQLPTVSSPRVVGLDDWSWKRGLRYGTLICDLESKKPIDVLADRSVQTVSAWFEKRPSVAHREQGSLIGVRSRHLQRRSPGDPGRRLVAYRKEFSRECANIARSRPCRNTTRRTRTGHAGASTRREGTRAGTSKASSTLS